MSALQPCAPHILLSVQPECATLGNSSSVDFQKNFQATRFAKVKHAIVFGPAASDIDQHHHHYHHPQLTTEGQSNRIPDDKLYNTDMYVLHCNLDCTAPMGHPLAAELHAWHPYVTYDL